MLKYNLINTVKVNRQLTITFVRSVTPSNQFHHGIKVGYFSKKKKKKKKGH